MTASPNPTHPFDVPELSTPEAYVAWMGRQPYKMEMAGGRLVMVASSGNAHGRIAANAVTMLGNGLRGSRWRPFGSDFLVQVGPRDRYYPDASVAGDERRDHADRPVLVVEVLSPRDEAFDLRVKLPSYLRTPGLRYVLYLSSDETRARLYRPGLPGADELFEFRDPADQIPLPKLSASLPLAELYEGVRLDGGADP